MHIIKQLLILIYCYFGIKWHHLQQKKKKDHIYTFITDPSWIPSLTHSSLLLQSVGKAFTINKYFKNKLLASSIDYAPDQLEEFRKDLGKIFWKCQSLKLFVKDKIEMRFLSIAVSKIYLNINMEFCLDVVYSLFMFLITFTSSLQKKNSHDHS